MLAPPRVDLSLRKSFWKGVGRDWVESSHIPSRESGRCTHGRTWGTRAPVVCIKNGTGTSLVVQRLRIHLPMQGTRDRALVRKSRGATKPVRHNYWACTLEPMSHNYWAHKPQLLKPAHLQPVLCNEKPPQWEARVPQRRVAPARRN